LVFRKEADKTIFWGPIKNNGNTLTITFTNLLSYDFYEME